MKKHQLLIYSISICLLLICGCNSSESDVVTKQRENIERYLTQNLNLEESEFDRDIDGIYRYIAKRDELTDELPAAIKGSSMEFFFEAHTFTSEPKILYYTNKQELIEKNGFQDSGWSTDPIKLKVGEGSKVMKCIDKALPGLKKGDSVLLFIPSNKGYGDRSHGIVEPNTALQFTLNITEVKNE